VRENEAWRRPPIERGLRHGTSSRLAPPDLDDNFHTVALEVLSAVPESPDAARRRGLVGARVTFGPMVHRCGQFVPVWRS
jgi:hypothetical protein